MTTPATTIGQWDVMEKRETDLGELTPQTRAPIGWAVGGTVIVCCFILGSNFDQRRQSDRLGFEISALRDQIKGFGTTVTDLRVKVEVMSKDQTQMSWQLDQLSREVKALSDEQRNIKQLIPAKP